MAKTNKNTTTNGLKEGYTRATFILPSELIEKVKAIAHINHLTNSYTLETMLKAACDEYEAQHGEVTHDTEPTKLL